jgi:uncharacterized protein YciI
MATAPEPPDTPTAMKFQRLSIVRLSSRASVPRDSPDDHRIQGEHIAYLSGLRDKGIIALNGPVRFKDSPKFRGMSICTVDVEEARALALADPAVEAGWFEVTVDGWWISSIPITLGNRVDIEK